MDDGTISTQTYVILEFVFFFGGILAVCAWQLWDLRRLRLEREARQRSEAMKSVVSG